MYEPSGRSSAARRSSARAPARSTRASRCGTPGPPDAREGERVAVAVVADLLDGERVPGGRALPPELLPRAAPEPRLAGLAGQPLGLGVHPREHQHAAVVGVLDDRRRAAQAASRSATPSACELLAQASRAGRILVQDRGEQRRLRDVRARRRRGARCPAPPEAITGTLDRCRDGRRQLEVVAGRVPSASIDVSRISPAPRSCASRAQSTALRDGLRRPGVGADAATLRVDRHDHRLRAEPAGELSDELGPRERRRVDGDLVGPRLQQLLRVGDERTPPPTVNGIASRSATRATSSTSVCRPRASPACRGTRARRRRRRNRQRRASTGSPMSRSSWKRTPLTTRPAATSRHGIRRGRGTRPPRARRPGSGRRPARSSPDGTGSR